MRDKSPEALETAAVLNYVRATWNEVAVDTECIIEAGFEVADFYGIPRPLRSGRFVRAWPRLAGIVGTGLVCAWFSLFFPLLLVTRAVVWGHRIMFAPEVDLGQFKDRRWILATTSRAPVVIPRVPAPERPSQWLAAPWIPLHVPEGDKVVRIEQLLKLKDLTRVMRMSWSGARAFSRKRGRPWRLQTFTAFEWFCTWLAISRVDITELWIANHYDRWAVLADRYRPGARGVLVQHGSVMAHRAVLVQHGVEYARRLKTRLNSIGTLYVFDPTSADVFQRSIVASKNPVKVIALRPTLDLTPWALKTGKRAIALVVGHPSYTEVQLAIIRHLAARVPDLQMIYKGHPLFPVRENPELSRLEVEVIKGRDVFPDASLVISYNSTLAHEYAAMGRRVFFHERNVDQTILLRAEEMTRAFLRGEP